MKENNKNNTFIYCFGVVLGCIVFLIIDAASYSLNVPLTLIGSLLGGFIAGLSIDNKIRYYGSGAALSVLIGRIISIVAYSSVMFPEKDAMLEKLGVYHLLYLTYLLSALPLAGIAFVGGITGSYVGKKIGLHETIKDYIKKISAFPIKRSKGEKIKALKNKDIRYKIYEYKNTIAIACLVIGVVISFASISYFEGIKFGIGFTVIWIPIAIFSYYIAKWLILLWCSAGIIFFTSLLGSFFFADMLLSELIGDFFENLSQIIPYFTGGFIVLTLFILVIFAIISYIFADPEDKGLVKETIFGSVFFGLFSGSILWFTLFIPPIIIPLFGMITLAGSGFVFLLLFGSVTPVIGVGAAAYLLTQNTTIAVILALIALIACLKFLPRFLLAFGVSVGSGFIIFPLLRAIFIAKGFASFISSFSSGIPLIGDITAGSMDFSSILTTLIFHLMGWKLVIIISSVFIALSILGFGELPKDEV
jgi:hypothetical protein